MKINSLHIKQLMIRDGVKQKDLAEKLERDVIKKEMLRARNNRKK